MGKITELLAQLQQEMTRIGASVVQYLNEGIDNNKIDELLKDTDIEFDEDLYELYNWKNGTFTNLNNVPRGVFGLFPSVIFISIEKAIDIYKFKQTDDTDDYWKPKMFPIFGPDDFYLIDLDKRSPTYKKIFIYCFKDPNYDVTITRFDSLRSCLESILMCYQKGVYFLDSRSIMLDWDYVEEIKIFKSLNPNSDYWKLPVFDKY